MPVEAASDATVSAASDATVHGGVLEPVPTDDRLEGSLAMATWGGFLGVDMVRVHDVRATVHAVGVIAR